MIIGTGIDLTEIERIRQMLDQHPKMLAKILTPAERDQYDQRRGQAQIEYLAGRFSLKESFGKALGTGIGTHFSFQDASFLDDKLGKPYVVQTICAGPVHVSVTHTAQLVMTQVIIEGKQ